MKEDNQAVIKALNMCGRVPKLCELLEEIERLNNKVEELMELYTGEREVKDYYKNIINELEDWLLEHSKIDYSCSESIVHEQLALGIAFNYLQELKGEDKE